jgi:hypothetical protein
MENVPEPESLGLGALGKELALELGENSLCIFQGKGPLADLASEIVYQRL